MVTLDTQRADYIGAYGSDSAKTPAIDSQAREGLLFENAYSLIPITLPSHASIFFSTPPHEIKSYNNGHSISKKRRFPSLGNMFHKGGFATGAFISLGVLESKFNLNDGFDEYVDAFPENRWYLSADEVNNKVFPWLKSHKNQKFFLWVHYSDPHDPYAPPYTPNDTKIYLNGNLLGEYCLNKYLTHTLKLDLKKGENKLLFEVSNPAQPNPRQFMARFDMLDFVPDYDEKDVQVEFSRGWFIRRTQDVYYFKNKSSLNITCTSAPRSLKIIFRGKLLIPTLAARDSYRKEVEFMDGEIGKLWDMLRRLDLYDTSAVMIVGDHGEGLGEYLNPYGDDHFGHIHYLKDIYTRVPLIIRSPSLAEKGKRRSEIVSLLDVAPTALGLMGLKSPPSFQGRNLLNLKTGEKTIVFQETYKPEAFNNRFAILDYPWHLMTCPDNGQYELFNLIQDHAEQQNLLKEGVFPAEALSLKEKLNAFARKCLKDKEEIYIDKKTEEMLKALGYVGNK